MALNGDRIRLYIERPSAFTNDVFPCISFRAETTSPPKATWSLMDFAALFTQRMDAKNIHRVFHTTDPVPMIPIYPYSHSPLPGYGHRIKSNQKIHTIEAHDMTGYINSLDDGMNAGANYMADFTVAAFADLGYTLDTGADGQVNYDAIAASGTHFLETGEVLDWTTFA